ncbi:MAG: hypothetical protein QM722_01055 [Piscinibacter sp.]
MSMATAGRQRITSSRLDAGRAGLDRHDRWPAGLGAGAPDRRTASRWPIAASTAKAHVYTEREAELAALMPVKVAADTGKKLLCPMPGLVKAIARHGRARRSRPARRLRVVEAMKMENVLRAERDGTVQEDQRQGRRQPRRRRGDHGVRIGCEIARLTACGSETALLDSRSRRAAPGD